MGMLQVAFDAATDAMLVVDQQRRVHWANQAAATLLHRGVPIAVTNRELSELFTIAPDDRKLHQSGLFDRQARLPDLAGQAQCVLQLADGRCTTTQRLRWQRVELVESPFLLISIRDLGPEERALHQQKQFMVDLTHELRTPLAIVTGSLHRISRLIDAQSPVSARLDMAQEEVKRIHRLLDNLTVMTRLQVDSEGLGLVQASLLGLFEEWKRGLDRPQAGRLQFDFEDSDVSVDVQVDVNAFYLVMDQVFDNGLRHGMEDQMITVGLDVSDAEVVSVCVTSLGDEPPQSPEILQSWKDPFRRGALQRRVRSAEGAGLGLALVSQLVDQLGGRLTLDQIASGDRTMTKVVFTLKKS